MGQVGQYSRPGHVARDERACFSKALTANTHSFSTCSVNAYYVPELQKGSGGQQGRHLPRAPAFTLEFCTKMYLSREPASWSSHSVLELPAVFSGQSLRPRIKKQRHFIYPWYPWYPGTNRMSTLEASL